MTIHLDRVAEAIEEAERNFSSDGLLPLSAKFNGRTLGRDSKVPKTSFQKPLELFYGMLLLLKKFKGLVSFPGPLFVESGKPSTLFSQCWCRCWLASEYHSKWHQNT